MKIEEELIKQNKLIKNEKNKEYQDLLQLHNDVSSQVLHLKTENFELKDKLESLSYDFREVESKFKTILNKFEQFVVGSEKE